MNVFSFGDIIDLWGIQELPPQQKMPMRKVDRLCSTLNRLLFSDVNFVEIKASETLFACCCFTSLCKRYVWFTMFLPHLSLNIILNGDMDSSAQRNIEIYSVVCRYMRYHFMLFTNPTNNEKGLLIGLKPAVQSFFK